MYNVVRGDAGAAAGAAYCIRYFNAIFLSIQAVVLCTMQWPNINILKFIFIFIPREKYRYFSLF